MRKMLFASTIAALAIGYANTPRTEPQLTGTLGGLTPPERKSGSRGSTSPYPFNTLDVGHAFGVKNKDARGMSSIVSNQNRKHKAKGPDGAETQTKLFRAFDVTDDYRQANKEAFGKGGAFEGAKTLVFRLNPTAA